ncbi:thiolase family protein [Enhydrobacter sp.]|jgi:acetyl-CoA acetyltransferase|uniref:thiolase family protein n=1 Tax=Enhydrobacter sp. TaxID=1894999 RepID=UPI00262D0C2E|nr:thiolase family protein [Enhydrobacter sp.]WIM12281.1 MAG: 3-ketoacyl-CoA thiolase [Enhydrobacter sp.]
MRDVYVVGAYTTAFKKHPGMSFADLAREAYLGTLADAGMKTGADIEAGWLGNCGMGFWGQNSIRAQALFQPLVEEGLFPERVPMFNVENACATASTAFMGAWKDVLAGTHELSFCIGIEKLFSPEAPERTASLFNQGYITDQHDRLVAEMNRVGEMVGARFEPGDDRTIFMDTYAMQAKWHMWKYGTTQEQIAIGAAKNHNYGSLNEKAQYRFQMTPQSVLEDRPVSYPLTRAMCAPIGDGAAAALLCSKEYLEKLPKRVRERAVRIAGVGFSGGMYRELDKPGLTRAAADKAYRMASLGPQDIDVAEVHDATSFCEIYQCEMLRFCPEGEGGKFVESGATGPGGRLPVNTSGGLVSKGHPVGATGLSMLAELATQLRGEAGQRQVKGAEVALAENGGGVIGMEEAVASVVILQRV